MASKSPEGSSSTTESSLQAAIPEQSTHAYGAATNMPGFGPRIVGSVMTGPGVLAVGAGLIIRKSNMKAVRESSINGVFQADSDSTQLVWGPCCSWQNHNVCAVQRSRREFVCLK